MFEWKYAIVIAFCKLLSIVLVDLVKELWGQKRQSSQLNDKFIPYHEWLDRVLQFYWVLSRLVMAKKVLLWWDFIRVVITMAS